ncbi:solute carrier family 35 member F6 [Schistocerca piceifrons]|uniref:solute carrier family 35 member F6 n=1 Tax=Schistocerca piceifrons TaxID=274613 RepID=UPI001F5F7363|nr:solute carrier family 35 member F6 [Schistocerca piceifrons]
MAWTKYQIVLAVVLVVTGSINTLTTKWADRMTAKGSDGVERKFDHPFVQSCAMFLGEMLCLLAFEIISCIYYSRTENVEEPSILRGRRDYNPFVLLPPALCDMVATSVMYIGLNLTNASSFQMLRGAVIVFVGIFSRIFLHRILTIREWIGILFVILGLVVVSLSDLGSDSSGSTGGTTNVILGDVLIIGAQIIAATQMVLEEKFVSGLDIPPMQAVGWEGVFGLVIMGLLQIPFYYIHVPPPFSDNASSSLEDVPDAFAQMADNNLILVALLGTVVSIAFFNFAGISTTKEISATTRMILDSVRTLVIWIGSVSFQWQSFHYLQVIGFIILLLGMCLYNNILVPQAFNKIKAMICRRQSSNADLEDPLVSNQPADAHETGAIN